MENSQDISENFIISTPYALDFEDLKAIEKASHGNPQKEDWDSYCLRDFKNRVRKYYRKEQGLKCAYCRMDISLGTNNFYIEHIVPKSTHPEWMYEPANLCLSCVNCNSSKNKKNVLLHKTYSKFPTASNEYLIVNPHTDNYFENIEIVEGLLYKGLTEKGMYTIDVCHLTRTDLLLERAKKRIEVEQDANSYLKLMVVYSQNRAFIDDIDELLDSLQEMILTFVKTSRKV